MALYDEWGGPNTYPHFAMGWAWAGNAPFPWVKQIAGHLGGSRCGMAVSWPKGIQARGEIRSQFYHLIDVAPTILEAASIPQPKKVNGFEQKPMDGVSMLASFADAKAPENHLTPILQRLRQPRHLPRRLARRHRSQRAVDLQREAAGTRR